MDHVNDSVNYGTARVASEIHFVPVVHQSIAYFSNGKLDSLYRSLNSFEYS